MLTDRLLLCLAVPVCGGYFNGGLGSMLLATSGLLGTWSCMASPGVRDQEGNRGGRHDAIRPQRSVKSCRMRLSTRPAPLQLVEPTGPLDAFSGNLDCLLR